MLDRSDTLNENELNSCGESHYIAATIFIARFLLSECEDCYSESGYRNLLMQHSESAGLIGCDHRETALLIQRNHRQGAWPRDL